MQNEVLFKDDMLLKWIRDRLFMDLIYGEGDRSLLREQLARLQGKPFFAFPALALLEAAGFGTKAEEKRKYAEQLRDDLHRHPVHGSIVFMDEAGRVGLLFSWLSKHTVDIVRSRLDDRFAFPVNIGVGEPCNRLDDIRHSYRQALSALQHKFYQGTGNVIYFSEPGKYRKVLHAPPEAEKELLESVVTAGDASGIGQAVDRFYRHLLQNGPIEPECVHGLTIRLLDSMDKAVLQQVGKNRHYKRCEIMSVVGMETLQEIKSFVAGHFTRLWEAVKYNDTDASRSIIKKTIVHMEQHCDRATLHSAAQMAEMTPAYLSFLFKLNTGKTFIEQLTEIRMEKAKELLALTNLKTYEVAEKVGYKDSRYFSQIFKKNVGVSPSGFRDSRQNSIYSDRKNN
ncbi:helix-turn-helix domain-containing protein [Paenibacillus piri]|uniref:AraC family transcriptional regulator n=1 Tax=Paenibacillus piri TaxID=2547395 RepID=A0A4V2ZSR4_9BACL|nr:helix-turn-helix domain-containing protein [Paenibacillus piri]TDF94164.1 AraC family transcriptional regulator [Paenibacillus piri]